MNRQQEIALKYKLSDTKTVSFPDKDLLIDIYMYMEDNHLDGFSDAVRQLLIKALYGDDLASKLDRILSAISNGQIVKVATEEEVKVDGKTLGITRGFFEE